VREEEEGGGEVRTRKKESRNERRKKYPRCRLENAQIQVTRSLAVFHSY
jgi:hypothetical protein